MEGEVKKKKGKKKEKWLSKLNHDTIGLNTRNIIVRDGRFSGMAEEILASEDIQRIMEKPPLMPGHHFSLSRQDKIMRHLSNMKSEEEKKGKRKSRKLTRKEVIKKLIESGPNIDAIMRNVRNVIVKSGDFPGMARDILAKERHRPPKRLFRQPMISR
jgi:hypothetical protein